VNYTWTLLLMKVVLSK